MAALMKWPRANTLPFTVKLMAEKSGLPTSAAMSGVSKSAVKAETTVAKAAPITTPTAISMTLPRKINCLNPLSIGTSKADSGVQLYGGGKGPVKGASHRYGQIGQEPSNPHGHHDVPVLVILAVCRTHLAGRLRIFEFEFHVSASRRLEKVLYVLRIETDRESIAVVVGFQRIFGLASFAR